jgi:hypothetical protein
MPTASPNRSSHQTTFSELPRLQLKLLVHVYVPVPWNANAPAAKPIAAMGMPRMIVSMISPPSRAPMLARRPPGTGAR